MDQLIEQLEQKIAYLVKELNAAKKEAETLRHQLTTVINSEHHQLDDNSKIFPSTNQLQMYIDDSLDISISEKKPQDKSKARTTGQLTFDLPFNNSQLEPSKDDN